MLYIICTPEAQCAILAGKLRHSAFFGWNDYRLEVSDNGALTLSRVMLFHKMHKLRSLFVSGVKLFLLAPNDLPKVN
jgi:hypothetical protein